MNVTDIAALATAIVSIITAVTALVKTVKTTGLLKAAQSAIQDLTGKTTN